MTEEKQRFTIEADDENFVQILDNNIQIGQYNVCKLLNQLVEENDLLQLEISKLTDLLGFEIEKNAKLLQEINSLKIENMRLKELSK